MDQTIPECPAFGRTDQTDQKDQTTRQTRRTKIIGNTPGQEAEDPEVLLDGVNYYYTVDDPGQ